MQDKCQNKLSIFSFLVFWLLFAVLFLYAMRKIKTPRNDGIVGGIGNSGNIFTYNYYFGKNAE